MSKNAEKPNLTWPSRLRNLGFLRLILLFVVLVLLILVPAPGTRMVEHGWPLARTTLIPILAPLVVMVLLLDALMARIFMTDAAGPAHLRFKTIMMINLFAALILVLRWLPYYAGLRV